MRDKYRREREREKSKKKGTQRVAMNFSVSSGIMRDVTNRS